MSRNPINGPVEDDEEDGDIPLCIIEVIQPPKDSEDSELTAKIQMIQIIEQAEEHFKLDNHMNTLPSYAYEELATFQVQDVDISKVRYIINLKIRMNKSQRNKLPPYTRKLLPQRKRLIFVNNFLHRKVWSRMGREILQYVVPETLKLNFRFESASVWKALQTVTRSLLIGQHGESCRGIL